LIIHSRDDEIVPFSHGQRLFQAASQPRQFLEIHGGHNTGFLMSRDRYIEGIDAFLDAHLDKASSLPAPKDGP
jgi:fermentation-respiration switch protein FrsA (DUF1100 family)